MMKPLQLKLLALALLVPIGNAMAETVRFEEQVLPILYHHCFSCHSEKQEKPKGGLRLDSVEAILESDTILPGKPETSEALIRVSLPHTDEDVMPPLEGGALPLSKAERETLRKWIADGADFGGWTKFEHRDAPLAPKGFAWSEKEVPDLAGQIDDLVQRHHEAKGTRMNAAIDDETFLRRVYLDVAGRIPSLAESTPFLESSAADKRSLLIAELLASEAHASDTFNWKADQLRLITRSLTPGQPGWLYDEWLKAAVRSRMPYDEFVRQLLTASGYLWENGAVGFYLRDLGMPLDHLSNLTRVFLGTRIECAQCHDHPLEPVTQKDFFQMAAFTFGVTNLGSPGGYSNDNVAQWPEIRAKLAALGPDKALSDGVSSTISYLKRLTKDTYKPLTFPKDYATDTAARGQAVEPRTLFGDEAVIVEGDRRAAFAEWMTSPRNPRFAKNIANRLWKRVMGVGLIEPEDSLSALDEREHAELIDFLTRAMIGLNFDERAFLAILLNTRLYQSEAVRETPDPGAAFALQGPQLRRLSAEQIWDSLLVLIVPDLDERQSLLRYDQSSMNPERLRKLTRMSADEIIDRARSEMLYHERRREYNQHLAGQREEMVAAQASGDIAEVRRLSVLHRTENESFFSPELKALQMGGAYYEKESDPRWSALPTSLLRASETPLPLPLGHFLRQFGQSDRREIDAFNRDPNTTHSLALMNGDLTGRILADGSHLRRQLADATVDGEELSQLVYRAILVRSAAPEELAALSDLATASPTPEQDLIWSLLNSPEFLFTP